MPPWVARQWHVFLWKGHGSASTRPNPASLQRLLTKRSYTQTSDGDNDHPQRWNWRNSAIIIPRSVVGTTPEDLVKYIEPVSDRRLTGAQFAVFLVTPSFAPWLLDNAAFMPKAIHQMYSNHHMRTKVDALFAVVDRLPASKSIKLGHDKELLDDALRSRMKQPPVNETGFEGLAYTTLPLSDSIPTISPPTDDQPAISFYASRTSSHAKRDSGYSLRLPLANTVFQTGSPSTMVYSSWEMEQGATHFALKSARHVTHHGIKIHSNPSATRRTSALAIPLVPLTVPRQVEASMGNILRRVTGPDGKSALASQELEQVVPQFYSARREPSQATMAWALIMSKKLLPPIMSATKDMLGLPADGAPGLEADLWEKLWKQNPAVWNELVPNAIAAGARLHRVLSGGGGWGKKAGLLSLDPVATTPEKSSSEDDIFNLASALKHVARDGEFIQFFVSPADSTHDAADQSKLLINEIYSKPRWSLELGTIPSTVDALSAGSWQHNPGKSERPLVLRQSFGALTEGGITISRYFKPNSSEQPVLLAGASKVDVPFSRFSAVSFVSKKDVSEEDTIKNCLQIQTMPHHLTVVKKLYGDETSSHLSLPRLELLPADSRRSLPEKPLDMPEWRKNSARKKGILIARDHVRSVHTARSIRKVLTPLRVRDTQRYLAYLSYRFRLTDRTVVELTNEARELMHTIRQRRGKNLFKFVRTTWSDSIKLISVWEPKREALVSGYVHELENSTIASNATLYGLQKEFKDILSLATSRVFRQLIAQTDGITAAVLHSREKIAKIVDVINFRERIARITNNSAMDVYTLHISLRWCLGTMIMSRQRFDYPSPLARGIMPLEKKLVALRSFSGDLFHHAMLPGGRHDGEKDEALVERRKRLMRDSLANMEARHYLLKHLVLSEAAQRVEARNKLSEEALLRQNKFRMLAKARAGERGIGTKANDKIRYVFYDGEVDGEQRKSETEQLAISGALVKKIVPTKPIARTTLSKSLTPRNLRTTTPDARLVRSKPRTATKLQLGRARTDYVQAAKGGSYAESKSKQLERSTQRKKVLVDKIREWLGEERGERVERKRVFGQGILDEGADVDGNAGADLGVGTDSGEGSVNVGKEIERAKEMSGEGKGKDGGKWGDAFWKALGM